MASADVWRQVLEHFKNGLTQLEIASIDDMPSRAAIYRKLSLDPEFATEVAKYYTPVRGGTRYQKLSDEDRRRRRNECKQRYKDRIKATRTSDPVKRTRRIPLTVVERAMVLSGLRDGYPLSRTLGQDGAPSHKRLQAERAYDPRFDELVAALVPWKRRKHGRTGHPRYGQDVWDQVAERLNARMKPQDIAKEPGMPGANRIYTKRLNDPEFASRVPATNRTGHQRYPKKVWDDVLVLLGRGLSIRQIGRMDGFPEERYIRRRLIDDPTLARVAKQVKREPKRLTPEEAAARKMARDRARSRKRHDATRIRPYRQRSDLAGNTKVHVASKGIDPDAVLRQALAALPRYLSPEDRDDIAGNIVLAVLSGELAMQDIAKGARDFIKLQTADSFRTISTSTQVGENWSLGDALGL